MLSEMIGRIPVFFTDNILPAAALAAVGGLLNRTVLRLMDRYMARIRLEKAAVSLIRSVLRVVLYVLLGLMIASCLGIDVTGVVALASVASLALSLALQDALSNVMGGFTLLSNHPFRAGDYVEIAGQAGTVQSLDIAYTRLATPDNKIISIPNSAVVASSIVNYSSSGTRRVDIAIRVDYDADVQTVKEALLRAADIPSVLTEPAAPLAAIRSYGESNVEYILQIWTSAGDYWKTTFAVNENIRAEFDRAGIRLTYPHVNVHLDR